MAKVDITQTINDFEGNPIKVNLSRESIQVLQQCVLVVDDVVGKESADKVATKINEMDFAKPRTLKDLAMTALMTEEKEADKLTNFKLLQQLSNGDEADLGDTEREKIFNKIKKTYTNVMIVGRAKEMLIDEFEGDSNPKGKK